MDAKIKLIRECSWEEVFLAWYKNEGEDPSWINLAKERGFASWAEWRLQGYAHRFHCPEAKWGFYEIEKPAEVVSGWFGGPFRTWIEKYYNGAKTKLFAELADHEELKNHKGVLAIMNNYPKDSVIVALEINDGRIFVIEGSHRSCALAMMAKENKAVPEKLIFAIGKVDLDELPPVGQNTSQQS